MGNPIDPALFERNDLRPVLAGRDISTLYRTLHDAGISRRQIAQRTGQAQSEVAEIIKGTRRVDNYRVLERICEGLGIPRERMLRHEALCRIPYQNREGFGGISLGLMAYPAPKGGRGPEHAR